MLDGVAQPDGQAPGLQMQALAANAAPDAPRMPVPRDVIDEALGQKLLLGWIQNRAQTLHPLTMNLGRLEPAQAQLVLSMVALAVRSTGAVSAARRLRAAAWVGRVHGSGDQAAWLEAAIAEPVDGHGLMERIEAADLTGHGFAAVLGATDQRDAVCRAYADFVAARLKVGPEVARGLMRRYRG